jgi:predicted metal-binding protein
MENTMHRQAIAEYVGTLGATNCQFVASQSLVPEERIRGYCYENKCGCYQRHLTCPPNTGTVQEVKERLKPFKTGILIQYSKDIDVRNDKDGLRETKLKLHHIILETERYLKEEMGTDNVWGMIGGNCAWCDECAGYRDGPCTYPDKARVSMEALAIDVMALLEKLGLDTGFYDDKITWTGIVLLDRDI